MKLRLNGSESRFPRLSADHLFSRWITFLIVILIIAPVVSQATTVNYSVDNFGSGRWKYIYAVTNDTLNASLDEFTIYFDYGLYANLSIDTVLAGWDGLTIEPDKILGNHVAGYYDVLALAAGISSGDKKGGFRVSFDWLGGGTPGAQSFDIVNPQDFSVIESGTTIPINTNYVPEPSTIMLFVVGLIALVPIRKNIQ